MRLVQASLTAESALRGARGEYVYKVMRLRQDRGVAKVSYGFLDLASTVSRMDLKRIGSQVHTVQFKSALKDREYEQLAKALESHPEVTLRAYGSYDGSITNLDFLRFFPEVRRFSADALYNSLTNIEGLAYLSEKVESIGLGQTRVRVSLAPLARFQALGELFIEGHTKDIEVLGMLTSLRSLTLRSVTLPGLTLLRPLRELRGLELKLGGTSDLSELPNIGTLEYLELWMVKGLSDLSPIADLRSLEYLFLQALRQVTRLPEMSRLISLRRVWLQTMKGLTDLAPLRDAPSLTQLALVDMRHLQPEALRPLVGHPTLTSLIAGFGSAKKNDAAHALIPVPSEGDWRKPNW